MNSLTLRGGRGGKARFAPARRGFLTSVELRADGGVRSPLCDLLYVIDIPPVRGGRREGRRPALRCHAPRAAELPSAISPSLSLVRTRRSEKVRRPAPSVLAGGGTPAETIAEGCAEGGPTAQYRVRHLMAPISAPRKTGQSRQRRENPPCRHEGQFRRLTSIVSLDPITMLFDVDEARLSTQTASCGVAGHAAEFAAIRPIRFRDADRRDQALA